MKRAATLGLIVTSLVLFAGGSAASLASATKPARITLRSTAAVLPANAGSGNSQYGQGVFISSISCASAGDCSAVGSYESSSGGSEGLLLTEKNGKWRTGVEAALPSDARMPGPAVGLTSVSCASPGNCTAVGSYFGSSGVEGLLLTERAGRWQTGIEALLPANATPSSAFVSLNWVSCASAGNCSAVGSYTDSSDVSHPLVLTQTGGTWQAGIEPALPSNADSSGSSDLTSVSCSSAGNCNAVGNYESSSGQEGLLLTETEGAWRAGAEAVLPGNAVAGKPVFLTSISCASAGNCAAVGTYNDDRESNDNSSPDILLLTEKAGTWRAGVRAALPADSVPAGAPRDPYVDSVSCASAGDCVAVGSYTSRQYSDEGLLLSEKAGKWRTGVEARLPVAPWLQKNVYDAYLLSVSCASPGECTAVGGYTGKTSVGPGLLVSETRGRWETGVAVRSRSNPNAGVVLNTVSCPSAVRCAAAGGYGSSPLGLLVDTLPRRCAVPKLERATLRAAERSIRSHGCSVGRVEHSASRRVDRGHVVSQKPRPGSRRPYGTKVSLVVSSGSSGAGR